MSLSLIIKPEKIQIYFLYLFFVLLRVLTLWFDYGHWPEVNEALVEGIKTIQIDTWLQVIYSHTHTNAHLKWS